MKNIGISGNEGIAPLGHRSAEKEEKLKFYNVHVKQKNNSGVLQQPEIIDHMKPQYYFNAKNRTGMDSLKLHDSEEGSKASISKTP